MAFKLIDRRTQSRALAALCALLAAAGAASAQTYQKPYIKVSPFVVAHKISEPILLIHGEADNNTGTFPIQSERVYQALRDHGVTVRYVTLPLEAHGYAARETTEHVLWEMISWFDKHVKNAPPRKPGAETER